MGKGKALKPANTVSASQIDTITLWFNVKVGPQDIHLGLYNTFAESREGERDTTHYIYLAKVKKRIS